MRPGILLRLIATALLLAGASPALARHHHHHHNHHGETASGLAGDTLLIIRHAEKPEGGGPGLAPAGMARAEAYAQYFQHFTLDGAPVKIDMLIATADSAGSERPRLTLTPLSQASGLKIQQPFPDKEVKALAHWLMAGTPNRTILIAWHHGRLPKLLRKLGADPASLLPDGVWPSNVYDWVIALKYDARGELSEAKRIVEPTLVH